MTIFEIFSIQNLEVVSEYDRGKKYWVLHKSLAPASIPVGSLGTCMMQLMTHMNNDLRENDILNK